MTTTQNIISAIALSGILFAGQTPASLAGDANTSQTFKLFQGLSFEAGQKHGVGYFYNDAGRCKLILTLADESNRDDEQSLAITRYETAVGAGQITHYTSEGHAFEFACQANAGVMTFKALSTVASAQNE
jgi:hypothetical protein